MKKMQTVEIRQIKRKISKFIESGTLGQDVISTLRYDAGFVPKECELWDFKREIGSNKIAWAKTVCQIISFYNTYGGYLIYGVGETSKDTVFQPFGITPGDFKPEKIKDLIKAYTGDIVDFTYGEVSYEFNDQVFKLGVLHIPKRGASTLPVTFQRNGPEQNKKCLFKINDCFLRSGDE
jgi:predicted HTH transcriptional regulator